MYQTHYVPAYTNHLLHAILTFFTLGFWFPVWMIIWVANHNRTVARRFWVDMPQTQYAPGNSGWQHVNAAVPPRCPGTPHRGHTINGTACPASPAAPHPQDMDVADWHRQYPR